MMNFVAAISLLFASIFAPGFTIDDPNYCQPSGTDSYQCASLDSELRLSAPEPEDSSAYVHWFLATSEGDVFAPQNTAGSPTGWNLEGPMRGWVSAQPAVLKAWYVTEQREGDTNRWLRTATSEPVTINVGDTSGLDVSQLHGPEDFEPAPPTVNDLKTVYHPGDKIEVSVDLPTQPVLSEGPRHGDGYGYGYGQTFMLALVETKLGDGDWLEVPTDRTPDEDFWYWCSPPDQESGQCRSLNPASFEITVPVVSETTDLRVRATLWAADGSDLSLGVSAAQNRLRWATVELPTSIVIEPPTVDPEPGQPEPVDPQPEPVDSQPEPVVDPPTVDPEPGQSEPVIDEEPPTQTDQPEPVDPSPTVDPEPEPVDPTTSAPALAHTGGVGVFWLTGGVLLVVVGGLLAFAPAKRRFRDEG